ncbi:MAG: tyrosine-type recombinase/integrase [Clostridia bacterium]|nr:tyrosine-type recombinase/integrase [Clostridia bacterium]
MGCMKITKGLINDFVIYLREEEKSKATAEKYLRDVTAFLLWLDGEEADKSKVLSYKDYLIEKYAPASVNSVLSSLNSFFDYCNRYELKVKTLKIQRRIFSDSKKELTKEEYGKLLVAAKSRENMKLYYLMQTICSTGIRVSELRFITLEALKEGKAEIKNKGKLRVILLPAELCKILKKYSERQKITSGPVFVTRNRKPLDRSTIWKMMKSLCEDAGVSPEKVFPHNLRHLFARTYYSLQKDIVRLADILGHSNVNTTRIYTMETGDIHLRNIQKLGLLHT